MGMTLHTIYLSEHGAQVMCPATGVTYLPRDTRWSTAGALTCMASACPECDSEMKVKGNPSFDALAPQWHLHCLRSLPCT